MSVLIKGGRIVTTTDDCVGDGKFVKRARFGEGLPGGSEQSAARVG